MGGEGGLTMATYVLIHGAGAVGWYWHLVEAELRARGHDVVAPDLPCEDDSAGLPELAAEALKRGRPQSEARIHEPSPLKAWPYVPTRVLLCRRTASRSPATSRMLGSEATMLEFEYRP
jgi:alpha/beta hydrolase family protein